jgi:hypothetical protein
MLVQCPKCRDSIPTDGYGKPPWCPRCGTDLKANAATKLVPQLAGVGANSTCHEPTPGQEVVAEEAVAPIAAEEGLSSPSVAETAYAGSDSLDNPEHVFKAKLVWQAVAWLGALACFVIVAAAGSQLLSPAKNRKSQTGSILGVTFLFGIGGLGASYVGLRLRGVKYLLFPDRLVQFQGSRITIIPWHQIREVYHVVHPGWQNYRLVTRKARDITLTGDIKGHARLGKLIAERVADRLFPEAWRQLEAGRSVAFGPVTISQGGVICNGTHLPWHQIVLLTFGLNPREVPGTTMISNMIHLRLTPSCLVEMGAIPNYRVMEKLIRRVHPSCVPCAEV